MKKWSFVLVVLTVGAAAALAAARTVVAVVDPNCVAAVWAPPAGIDPNMIEGHLVPLDINDWSVGCGKFERRGTCCDPEGDPFDISCLEWTSPATVLCDSAAGTWQLNVEVMPGLNRWVLEVTDRPLYAEPATSVWTVIGLGLEPPNTPPILY